MTAYRFCRTDDMALLAEALDRCWRHDFPADPPVTPAAFKRAIRDLQVWCSSCMVAFSGSEPIGVLIGAKRPSATLVHRIAVHPDHRRQGHGRHLLGSLASKLAILGPPRIVAEVPETLAPARGLFRASGYVEEALLTDYVWRDEDAGGPEVAGITGSQDDRFVIPVTVDDLAANGLLAEAASPVCWERAIETLVARKDEIAGIGVASGERIEACLLYAPAGAEPPQHGERRAASAPPDRSEPRRGPFGSAADRSGGTSSQLHAGRAAAVAEAAVPPAARAAEILALRSFVENGGARLGLLIDHLGRLGLGTLRLPKVHPAEFSSGFLEALGFRPSGRHVLYAATARADRQG